MRRIASFLLAPVLVAVFATTLRADEISDWNENLLQSAQAAQASPLVAARVAAIFQAAVFDAVNGVERRFTPIHVQPNAPRGASKRAAAVQAAYAILVKLFPTQKTALDGKLAASLSSIASEEAVENSVSIARGREWGQHVADEIFAWRSADGFLAVLPPYLGGTTPGQWRPTPPALAPGVGVQFATMVPWVINSPNQFRSAGPPVLGSAQYATDYNEVASMGKDTSAARTADQTLYSRFWHASTTTYFWNRIAPSLSKERNVTFSEESRVLALVNIAIADAAIGCFDAKYFYSFWRPVTAIRLGDTDGNSATVADPTWTPLLVTPAFPEYPSGHSCASSAAARILSTYFGESTSFVVDSDSPTMIGVTRFFPNFNAALEEIKNARIFGGIHFRTATDDGQRLGTDVADYILDHAFLSIDGKRVGQTER